MASAHETQSSSQKQRIKSVNCDLRMKQRFKTEFGKQTKRINFDLRMKQIRPYINPNFPKRAFFPSVTIPKKTTMQTTKSKSRNINLESM